MLHMQSDNLFHALVNCHTALYVWITSQGPILPAARVGTCLWMSSFSVKLSALMASWGTSPSFFFFFCHNHVPHLHFSGSWPL